MNSTSNDYSLDKENGGAENTPENVNPDECSLLKFLCGSLAVLWKDWPRDMNVTVLDASHNRFSLVGVCPHCRSNSVFMPTTTPHGEVVVGQHWVFYVVMQCQGCRQYMLGIATRQGDKWDYKEHYPLGKPDDSVHEKVPVPIAEDFAESKRCLWIKAYRASVAMCRRSLQSSCDDLGAEGDNLFSQIDDLAKRGVITEPLRQLAHKVRLVANKELHAKHKAQGKDKAEADADEELDVKRDDLGTITKKDAESIIAFTQEYFHHVYVMPALLKAYDEPEAQDEST